MTQEEKARAYDKALEKAKEIKSKILSSHLSTESCKAVSEYIDEIIPELRESEDERIRTRLSEYFRGFLEGNEHCYEDGGYVKWEGLDVKSILTWLEKQKEQKLDGLKEDYSGMDDVERIIHRGFLAAGVENVPVTIIKETAQECLAQMKPAEWGEEDEEALDMCLDAIPKKWKTKSGILLTKWLKEHLGPSWKPSEEQMNALRRAVNKLANTDVADSVRLSIMYDNLKKL